MENQLDAKVKKLFWVQLAQALWLIPFVWRLTASADSIASLPKVLDWFGMFACFMVLAGLATGIVGMKQFKRISPEVPPSKRLSVAKWLSIVNIIMGAIMVGMALLVVLGLLVFHMQ